MGPSLSQSIATREWTPPATEGKEVHTSCRIIHYEIVTMLRIIIMLGVVCACIRVFIQFVNNVN